MQWSKAKKSTCLIAVIFLLTNSVPSALAEDTKNRFFNQLPQDSYGYVINEDSASFGKNFSSLVAQTNTPSGSSNKICASIEDLNCAGDDLQRIGGIALMPPCEVDSTFECIEKLSLIDESGKIHTAKFHRLVTGMQFSGNRSAGLPVGSSISLWKIQDAEIQKSFAIVSAQQISSKSLKPMKFDVTGFKALVFEYEERKVPDAKVQIATERILPDGRSFISSPGPLPNLPFNCIWAEAGVCGVEQNLNPNFSLSLSLRVSNSLTGWLQGRLIDPIIDIKPFSSGLNLLNVTALPADVPMAAAAVNIATASQEIKSLFENRSTGVTPGQGVTANVSASNPEAFKFIQAFSGQTKDKAFSKSGQWSFGSIYSSQQNKCLQNNKKLIGLVTTNAMAYYGDPPRFENGFLQYQVAGLHLNPDGSIFRGHYDLLIDSAAARCLYRFTKAPISAIISVTSSEGIKQTAITTLNERKNWIYLSASNFTFSNPTIKIKLNQKKKR